MGGVRRSARDDDCDPVRASRLYCLGKRASVMGKQSLHSQADSGSKYTYPFLADARAILLARYLSFAATRWMRFSNAREFCRTSPTTLLMPASFPATNSRHARIEPRLGAMGKRAGADAKS